MTQKQEIQQWPTILILFVKEQFTVKHHLEAWARWEVVAKKKLSWVGEGPKPGHDFCDKNEPRNW